MSSLIRLLTKEDYHKGYLQLLSQLTECPDMTYDEWMDSYDLIDIYDNILIYVIELEDKIIGSGTIILEDKFIHDGGVVGHIEDVVIDKEHRENGYGKMIIDHLLQKAKLNGCYKVILDCDSDKINFYQKCDFMVKGIQMAYYF